MAGLLDLATSEVAARYSYGVFGGGSDQAVAYAPNGWVNRLQYGGREYDAEQVRRRTPRRS